MSSLSFHGRAKLPGNRRNLGGFCTIWLPSRNSRGQIFNYSDTVTKVEILGNANTKGTQRRRKDNSPDRTGLIPDGQAWCNAPLSHTAHKAISQAVHHATALYINTEVCP